MISDERAIKLMKLIEYERRENVRVRLRYREWRRKNEQSQ